MALTKTLPNVHGTSGEPDAPIRLLYINPNSTKAFTQETIDYFSPHTPLGVRIDYYTPPSSISPPSIDGTKDGVISAAGIMADLDLVGSDTPGKRFVTETYDGIIISCFSAHPLVPCLRECFNNTRKRPPVISIMESGIYFALQLSPTFGIATTGINWEPLFDEGVRALGIDRGRYIGTKGTGFNAVSLHGEGPSKALLEASIDLVERGARAIVLGCAGMAPMRAGIEKALAEQTGIPVPIIDGVQAGIDTAFAFARMGLSLPGRLYKTS